MGFEAEGFTVVQGPDVIFGRDIRDFHPPAGVFEGIIGGDPCQAHSSLANLVRAKGLEPRFGDLTGEYQRVVEEARPAWFLRENVPQAPDIKPAGYAVRSFLLDHCHLDSGNGEGHEQMRRRRFWFGVRRDTLRPGRSEYEAPELRRWIDFALFELPDSVTSAMGSGSVTFNRHRESGPTGLDGRTRTKATLADAGAVPVKLGGSGKVKATAVGGNDGICGSGQLTNRTAPHPPRRSLSDMLALQGLPANLLEHAPYTMQAKRKLVGNAVPKRMARALARAVRKALA
jgi:site-specific DNA-cytosine methylase